MAKGSINNAFVLIGNLWRVRDGVEVCMYSQIYWRCRATPPRGIFNQIAE